MLKTIPLFTLLLCLGLSLMAADERPPTLFIEAEEFSVAQPGWERLAWGSNYYAATFANSFLSRKAYLGADAAASDAVAVQAVTIPAAGDYQVLIRYEAVYRFETRFRLEIRQQDQVVFNREYGALANPKIWAFRQGIQPQVRWSWGAVENVVWEGHDAIATLQAGPAELRLIAVAQPEPAARRHVDLIMLTQAKAEVEERLAKENYLPLDGMLTQQGDVFLRIAVPADAPALAVTIPPGVEHSPYWVHLRRWSRMQVAVEPGERTDWIEIGSLLDSLNDVQLYLGLKPRGEGEARATVEVGMPGANGTVETLRSFTAGSELSLVFAGDMRYARLVETPAEILDRYTAQVLAERHPGRLPQEFLVLSFTGHDRRLPAEAPANLAATALADALAITRATFPAREGQHGYIDVRSKLNAPEALDAHAEALAKEAPLETIRVVSLGDEITLPRPRGDAFDEQFRAWLQEQGLTPADAGVERWEELHFALPKEPTEQPRLHYHAARFQHAYGIQSIKASTDQCRRLFPNAGIGANFSPHHGIHFLGEVHQWVTAFREEALTLPWSEDYVWQIPVGTQQMTTIPLAQFRAGLRHRPADPILWYVMPHTPGNTAASWRRQFYTAISHGMKILNLYQMRPLGSFGTTENYTDDPAMYTAVNRGLHELGAMESELLAGTVRGGNAAVWFSETSDIWKDQAEPFGAAKRALYMLGLHGQYQVDVVVEADALNGALADYPLLFLTDRHLTRRAAEAIGQWVQAGGNLIVTARAGEFDEYHAANEPMQELLGGAWPATVGEPQTIQFIKQDLPFAEPLDHVTWSGHAFPVVGLRSGIPGGGEVLASYRDGTPAVSRRSIGAGSVTVCGFLPGLSYFQPAIPRRPVDRGTTDEAMAHFLPTDLDGALRDRLLADQPMVRTLRCSEPLVAARLIETTDGWVIPLTNWHRDPVTQLRVELQGIGPVGAVAAITGAATRLEQHEGGTTILLDLAIADALLLKRAP